jgi:hypothetical protein
MFQRIKQWSEIKSYVTKLFLELFSRLGKRHYYTTEEVTQTAERAGFKTDYLAYAHALFCERKDFRRRYKRTKFRERYEALRGEVSDRYFGCVRDFDAANIIDAVHSLEIPDHFHESGEGYFGVFTH